MERRGKCLLKLSMISDAKNAFVEAVDNINEHMTDEKKKQTTLSDLEKLIRACETSKSKTTTKSTLDEILSPKCRLSIPKLVGFNPKMPSFTKAVDIAYSSKVK